MKNGKILVADDNDINRETLKEILMEEGYDVKTVSDGRQGIDNSSRYESGYLFR